MSAKVDLEDLVSGNAARDELSDLISDSVDADWICGDATYLAHSIRARGYSKPRTITNLEELLTLQLPAIIDCKNGGVAKVEYYAGPGRQKYAEFLFGDDESGDEIYDLAYFATFALPAEVLKEEAQ